MVDFKIIEHVISLYLNAPLQKRVRRGPKTSANKRQGTYAVSSNRTHESTKYINLFLCFHIAPGRRELARSVDVAPKMRGAQSGARAI